MGSVEQGMGLSPSNAQPAFNLDLHPIQVNPTLAA